MFQLRSVTLVVLGRNMPMLGNTGGLTDAIGPADTAWVERCNEHKYEFTSFVHAIGEAIAQHKPTLKSKDNFKVKGVWCSGNTSRLS